MSLINDLRSWWATDNYKRGALHIASLGRKDMAAPYRVVREKNQRTDAEEVQLHLEYGIYAFPPEIARDMAIDLLTAAGFQFTDVETAK